MKDVKGTINELLTGLSKFTGLVLGRCSGLSVWRLAGLDSAISPRPRTRGADDGQLLVPVSGRDRASSALNSGLDSGL
jgi:hypothetical protein